MTSYSRNTHLSNLFAYIGHSSFTFLLCMSIKTGLFFFLTFCCLITQISGIIDHYCIMKFFKKSGEIMNKLRTLYPKNMVGHISLHFYGVFLSSNGYERLAFLVGGSCSWISFTDSKHKSSILNWAMKLNFFIFLFFFFFFSFFIFFLFFIFYLFLFFEKLWKILNSIHLFFELMSLKKECFSKFFKKTRFIG